MRFRTGTPEGKAMLWSLSRLSPVLVVGTIPTILSLFARIINLPLGDEKI
jgi:hypothetical protein